MDILDLIDQWENMIANDGNKTLTDRGVVISQQVLEMVDQMSVTIPHSIK